MSDSLTVVNTTGLTVAPGGQIVEPDNPTEVTDCEQVQELLTAGALSLVKPTGRKAKTTQED
jgi:hypothetical protein